MKINHMIIRNFRGIGELELPLDHQLTVLVGVNGSGKSSVLDALAILLSWVVARIRHPGGSGRSIRELDIHNQANQTMISAIASQPSRINWQLGKTRQGYSRTSSSSELGSISQYAKDIQREIEVTKERCNIPLFAYYPVNRAVLDIPLRISKSHKLSLLEAWDDSLTSAANFRSFFEWFRNREDLENENRKYVDHPTKPNDWLFPDPQLEAVRRALEAFLPEFKQFSVRRNPLRMTVLKHGEEIRVDQLSDGEKCLIALIGDLARRLAICNPAGENPLDGEGVVLIDEIDLHLHPAWERMVIPRLIHTFPLCQFVISTHSPQVIGEVSAQQVGLLIQDDANRITHLIPKQSRGLTTNDILDELMRPAGATETLTRNSEVESQLANMFRLIDQEHFIEARAEIDRLKEQLQGDIPELVHAQSLLAMLDVKPEE